MDKSSVKGFRVFLKQEGLTPLAITQFQGHIWQFYHEHGRIFPWRETADPYHILVSEIMLQQTQVSRVVSKYNEFLATFPDFLSLSRASLREVLLVWQGLGYNRRALALQQTAQQVIARFNGQLPADPKVLQEFPGVGHYTAAAVAAIAFNKPTVFIETNIRAVFLHYFFEYSEKIPDHDLLPLVEATLEGENPREWYYALFDHGAMLKRQRKAIARFREYKQSPFRGSNREIRGQIIRLLVNREIIGNRELINLVNNDNDRVQRILAQLQKEGLITIAGDSIFIR